MIKFTTQVNGEEYEVAQHAEIFGLFFVVHKSGVHKIARNQTTGEYKFIEHRIGTEPIDLKTFADLIETELTKH